MSLLLKEFVLSVYADHARKEYETSNATSEAWWEVQVSKSTVVRLVINCSNKKHRDQNSNCQK